MKYVSVPSDFTLEKLELPDKLPENDFAYNTKKNTELNSSGNSVTGLRNLRNFDPNTVDSSTLNEFGLSEKQIRIFLNYRNKGATFYKKEDVSTVYGITQKEYELLYPYIDIKEDRKQFQEKHYTISEKKHEFEIIEINSADSVQLKKLPLIGAGRARMIVNYRNSLGGYFSIQQLNEVYSIDSIVFSEIKDKVMADTTLIRKIDLNSDDIKHPYLNYTVIRAIKAFRTQHGNFQHIEELKKMKLIEPELYNKLAPYLTIE